MILKPGWCNWKCGAGKLWSKADSGQGQGLLSLRYLLWTPPYHMSLPENGSWHVVPGPWSPGWLVYLSQFDIFVLCQIEDNCCIKETRFFFDKGWIHFDILKEHLIWVLVPVRIPSFLTWLDFIWKTYDSHGGRQFSWVQSYPLIIPETHVECWRKLHGRLKCSI